MSANVSHTTYPLTARPPGLEPGPAESKSAILPIRRQAKRWRETGAHHANTRNNSKEKNTVNATSTRVATLSRATGDTPVTLVGLEPTCADSQSAPSSTRAQRQHTQQ